MTVKRIEEAQNAKTAVELAEAKAVLSNAAHRMDQERPCVVIVAILGEETIWTDSWAARGRDRLAGVGLAEFAKDRILDRVRDGSHEVEPEPESDKEEP